MHWIIHTYSARYAELNRISENVLRYYPAQPVEHILSSGPESDMFSAWYSLHQSQTRRYLQAKEDSYRV